MRNIMPVIAANLRKGKGQAISLLVFTLIAALLLSLGLLLMLDFGDFFDRRSEALHAPHYALVEETGLYTSAQEEYLRDHEGVTEVEHEQAVSFFTDISYGGGKAPAYLVFLDAGTRRSMNDLTLVEGEAPVGDKDICLPYLFKAGGGYGIGDDFTTNVGGRALTFKVSGFTEEILFGSFNNQLFQLYLSSLGYDALLALAPGAECVLLRARLNDPAKSEALHADCAKEFVSESDGSRYVISMNWSSAKRMRTLMSGVTSSILVVFASLIVLVSLLVVRFRIRNSIEEGMENVGALKAVGYTGRQLLWATVLQFLLIALVGVLAGIGLSYAVLPAVSHILEQQTALPWRQGFDATTSLLAFASILLAVLAVTWLSARRIRNLQPLAALRQGLATHSFRKNRFPLDRSRGPLSLLLAAKAAVQAKGQAVMIFIIVTAVSFAAAAGLAVYSNLGLNPDMFARLLSGEMPDAAFFVKDSQDAVRVRDAIEGTGEARKVFYYQSALVMIDDREVTDIVAEDFGLLEGSLLYEGRYPRHDNELCVSGTLAAMEGFALGSAVEVAQGNKAADYLVVGLIQTVNSNGMAVAMTIPGIRRIQPGYEPRWLYVYLTDNAEAAGFVDSVSTGFAEELESTVNIQEALDAQVSMYGNIFFTVAVVLVAVTALVIFLTLYLMLKTVILRRRRELGIQKALGFTTMQLMNQFALYFIPVIAAGIAAGGLLGIVGFNSVFVALTKGMGIMTASLPAPVPLTVAVCAGLLVLSYAFALLVASRIRKISAYALVSE
ncbi:MAG: FtsX-like permease family protein [Coriobacteriales bacterium]|jgi:putative ABC transport system permease protein|nr:FtsX-like permease family protein [Coriobacteriales bacterium]